MLCDVCNKNQATVHLTEIIDDQMNELHLCEDCARQKSAQMESQFGLSDLLAGMVEFGKPTKEKDEEGSWMVLGRKSKPWGLYKRKRGYKTA